MLTEREREFIEEQLLVLTAGAAAPRQVLAAGLVPRLQLRLGDGPPAVLVPKAIDLCIEDQYQESPPALAHLLRALLLTIGGVQAILNRIATPPPPPPDPFEALVLDTKLPFLDRKKTRAALRALTTETPKEPIVLIVGGSKSGKSYTAEFIDFLCRRPELRGVQHCLVEVPATEGASIGPGELAADIVTRVGGDPAKAPTPNTNLERWTQDLANWIIAEAGRSGLRWWFVLDGFNARELRPDTGKLIVRLAKGLTTGMAQRLHRLILLDFDRAMLTIQPGKVALDETGGIPASAVMSAVAEVARMSSVPLDVPAFAAKIMDGMPDPVLNLPELGNRFRDLVELV